jgi:hypothetical protein
MSAWAQANAYVAVSLRTLDKLPASDEVTAKSSALPQHLFSFFSFFFFDASPWHFHQWSAKRFFSTFLAKVTELRIKMLQLQGEMFARMKTFEPPATAIDTGLKPKAAVATEEEKQGCVFPEPRNLMQHKEHCRK